MLAWALVFFIVAIIAGILGFTGIAAGAAAIAQVLFFEGDEMCDTSYADRKGKYQSQDGVVLPRV